MEPLKVASYYDADTHHTDSKSLEELNREPILVAIAFFIAFLRCYYDFSDGRFLIIFMCLLGLCYLVFWFYRRRRIEKRLQNQITPGHTEKSAVVLFTFCDYHIEKLSTAVTCKKSVKPSAVSELEPDRVPKGYSVIKEKIYPYDCIKSMTVKDNNYHIKVYDDDYVIRKTDCSRELVDFLDNLMERTGK